MNDQKLCRGVELEGEHVRRGCEAERSHALRLRERQRFFEEAFQQDVEHYLSTGVLQLHSAGGARQPLGSVSSMEVNVDLLEQVELLDVSDQEALDVFLNSPSGASSGASSSASATSSVSSMGPSCQTSPRHVWRASSTSSSSEASGPDSTPLFSPLPATPLPPATPTTAAAGNLTPGTGAGVGAVNRGDEEDNEEEEEEEGSGAAVPCVQADEEEVFVDTALTATTEDDSSPRPCDSDTD